MVSAVTLINVEKDCRCRIHSLTFHPIRQADHRNSRPTSVVICWSADLCEPCNTYIFSLGFKPQRYEPALSPQVQCRGNGSRLAGQWTQKGRFYCEGTCVFNFLIFCFAHKIAIQDGETHTVPITLIALHHGEFALPKISISALPMAGTVTMGSMAIPSIETYQVHGAEKVLVLPRGGRSTFVVGMGPG